MIKKTIGIAGAQAHIGTTTQALQLLQYLQLMGNKVCYVEMNEHGYIKNLLNLFENVMEKEQGHIVIDHVELYESQHIKGLARKEYDYVIKDYGNLADKNFNTASYTEQGQKIFVAGIKANEIFQTQAVLKDSRFDDVSFILSFVDNSLDLRNEIKGMFDCTERRYSKSEKVFFADYAADPFEYTGISNKHYSDLLNVDGAEYETKI